MLLIFACHHKVRWVEYLKGVGVLLCAQNKDRGGGSNSVTWFRAKTHWALTTFQRLREHSLSKQLSTLIKAAAPGKGNSMVFAENATYMYIKEACDVLCVLG